MVGVHTRLVLRKKKLGEKVIQDSRILLVFVRGGLKDSGLGVIRKKLRKRAI